MPNKTYKHITLSKLKFICHNNTWQYEVGIHSSPIEDGATKRSMACCNVNRKSCQEVLN